ncbi:MAG TPA: DUF4124 domain-containing protein [Pseudomonadales bacterium]|nr:DUF4124 domain-containing protein [Pseudomonadales bacterium]
MRLRGGVLSALVLLAGLSFAGGVGAEVYKWVDADGTVHFSDSAGSSKAEKIEVKQPERMAPLPQSDDDETEAAKTAPPASVEEPSQPEQAADNSKKSRKKMERLKKAQTAEKQKANEKICQLRYGMHCDDLFHWKSKLKAECERNKTDSCEEPQYFIRNKPPSILFRDLGKPFPTVDNTPKQDLDCLLSTGFYCYELNSDTYCKQNYDVKQCKELREWVKTAEKRCAEEGKEDCSQRALAFRPRTGEELNKIRYGTDLAVEQDEVKEISRMPSNRDKYIQRLWEIVNQYPGD